jgi:hypothetical protein
VQQHVPGNQGVNPLIPAMQERVDCERQSPEATGDCDQDRGPVESPQREQGCDKGDEGRA